MCNFFRITTLVIAMSSFATASQAWNWMPSPRGFVAVVQDGPQCKSLVTVFKQNHADLFGPAGWRIAYDKSIFVNNLGEAGYELGSAQAKAESDFYRRYFGTSNYKPTCYPPTAIPASQQPSVSPDSSYYHHSSSDQHSCVNQENSLVWTDELIEDFLASGQLVNEYGDVEIEYDGVPNY